MLEIIAFLLSLASFYYQTNDGGLGLNIPNNAVIWTVMSLMIVLCSLATLRKKSIFFHRFFLFSFLFLISVVFISFLNPIYDLVGWSARLLSIIIGVLFLFVVSQYTYSQRSIFNALYVFLIAFLLHSIVGVIQLIPGFYFDSFIPHTMNRQAVGMFQQKNLLGSLMSVQLVLCTFLYSSIDFKRRSVLLKVAIFISLFFSAFMIAAIGSRIAILASFISLVIIIFSRYKWLVNAPRLAILLFVFVGVFGFILGANSTEGVDSAFDKFERLSDASSDSRYHIYKISWLAFLENPVFGHGAESFQRVFYDQASNYQIESGGALIDKSQISHPHNELLYWAVEFGILAVLAIIIVFYRVLNILYMMGREKGLAYLSLLTPFLIHSLLELPFYTSAYHWFVFLFFIAIILRQGGDGFCFKSKFSRVFLVITLSVSFFSFIYTSTALVFSNEWRSYHRDGVQGVQYKYMKIHPHYRKRVEYIEIQRATYNEWEENKSNLVTVEFIEYLLEKLLVKPSVNMYVDLIRSYAYLDDFDSAYRVANEAFSYYPDNGHLMRTMILIQRNRSPEVIQPSSFQ